MTLPLTLGLLAAWIIGPALAIIALKGRRIKAVNDTRDEHTQGHGIGGANILNHVERN